MYSGVRHAYTMYICYSSMICVQYPSQWIDDLQRYKVIDTRKRIYEKDDSLRIPAKVFITYTRVLRYRQWECDSLPHYRSMTDWSGVVCDTCVHSQIAND